MINSIKKKKNYIIACKYFFYFSYINNCTENCEKKTNDLKSEWITIPNSKRKIKYFEWKILEINSTEICFFLKLWSNHLCKLWDCTDAEVKGSLTLSSKYKTDLKHKGTILQEYTWRLYQNETVFTRKKNLLIPLEKKICREC